MRAVSRALAIKELETACDILNKWIERLKEGVPGEDLHVEGQSAPDDDSPRNAEDFYDQLSGELNIVSGKCEVLSTVLSERS